MRDQGQQGTPITPGHGDERDEVYRGRHFARRWLWAGIVFGLIVAVLLGGWAVFLNTTSALQPLRMDAHTLYLADWSKDTGGWSGGAQWHWKQSGVISSRIQTPPSAMATDDLLFLAPYQPSSADYEVDAQIRSLNWGATFVGEGPLFGVLIGVDSQRDGYLCGSIWGKYIEHIKDWSAAGISDYVTRPALNIDFSKVVTFSVIMRNHLIRVLLNGQQVAQAALPPVQSGGSVGLLSAFGAIEVQGFRVEQLP